MADPIPCFWVEPTGTAKVSLRVFTFGVYVSGEHVGGLHDDHADHEACPSRPVNDKGYQWGHNASAVVFIETDERRDEQGRQEVWPVDDFENHPLWPATCESCGAKVTDAWVHQVVQDGYYANTQGWKWPQAELPVGAMWDAPWLHETTWCGDDGISLHVMLPPGGPAEEWCADCPSTDGRPWQRTGDPKNGTVTATPSIATPNWHGYLRDSTLVDA